MGLIGFDLVERALRGRRILVTGISAAVGLFVASTGGGSMLDEAWQALRYEGFLALAAAILLVMGCTPRGARPFRAALFGGGSAAIAALPFLLKPLFAISLPVLPALATLAAAALLVGGFLLAGRYLKAALVDAATGLANLASLERAAASRISPNVVVARIDHFDEVSSTLGPEASARFVLRVAERLSFSNQDAQIFRIDEHSLAWLEQAGDENSLEDRIDAIAAVMRAPIECGRLVDATLNFGLATSGGFDARQLVANAALAAQRAAKKGVRWTRFTDEETSEWHGSLLGELDVAIRTGQLWNAYQPQLDLASGAILGVEALIRWQHPTRGPVAPDAFIPLVEENGRARDLTAHVLQQALEDATRWENAGHRLGVSVNVSASLLADHAFIELVGQILQSSRIPAGRVTIEVTESAAMHNPRQAIAALESWCSQGVRISIDDYGTGESSLGYLQQLPATELKIDRSFIQNLAADRRNEIMVRSTVALAHELGMKVVAEGIEDEACARRLTDLGCDIGQGFHIGRPMPADGLLEYLRERPRAVA